MEKSFSRYRHNPIDTDSDDEDIKKGLSESSDSDEVKPTRRNKNKIIISDSEDSILETSSFAVDKEVVGETSKDLFEISESTDTFTEQETLSLKEKSSSNTSTSVFEINSDSEFIPKSPESSVPSILSNKTLKQTPLETTEISTPKSVESRRCADTSTPQDSVDLVKSPTRYSPVERVQQRQKVEQLRQDLSKTESVPPILSNKTLKQTPLETTEISTPKSVESRRCADTSTPQDSVDLVKSPSVYSPVERVQQRQKVERLRQDLSKTESVPPILSNKTLKQTPLETAEISTPKSVESRRHADNSSPQDFVDLVKSPSVCSPIERVQQRQKVERLRQDLSKTENILRTLDLSTLPDGGLALKNRKLQLQEDLQLESTILQTMPEIQPPPNATTSGALETLSWETLQQFSRKVQPGGLGGKRALETYTQQKVLTEDRLKKLHNSILNCPDENTLAEDPEGLKVELMRHQKHALAWMLWRETQKPRGGILADDMGLGKTLTMISLVLKSRTLQTENSETSDSDNDEENDPDQKRRSREFLPGGTLVICPASLIQQWDNEIKKHCRRRILDVLLYHGANRENRIRRIVKNDVVISTYNLVQKEIDSNGPLFNIKWHRIILDEGHIVRNVKSQTSKAVVGLKSVNRWVLTGTPIQNKELDLYALLRFLRCSPFDDLQIWKKWVGNKSAGGQQRLNTVMKSIMLRRTKSQLQARGDLNCLPERIEHLITINLSKNESNVYHKILLFSKTLFRKFLQQRAEKNVNTYFNNPNTQLQSGNSGQEYTKIHNELKKIYGTTEIKSHHILVLLLRLRQICNHPALIKHMLENGAGLGMEGIEGEESNDADDDLINQLNNMVLSDDLPEPEPNMHDESSEKENLGTAISKVLNHENPLFDPKNPSSKILKTVSLIKENVISQQEKAVVVSQWPSMLQLVQAELENERISSVTLSGDVPVNKRMQMIDKFNDTNSGLQVLLLSLTAGGVGLNLVGANHLLILDPHWNPQLEAQAQDRVYRVGQTRTVNIYKFVTVETIEERIKALQTEKMNLATAVLTGTQLVETKLSVEDLKMLFNIM